MTDARQAHNEAVMEQQLRQDCYDLHALRSEVADNLNKQRDVECRHEYLRTVLVNMERAENELKRTLAYEAATSDSVLKAAREGQPLPPALAADAATSVLCPPVHMARDSKNLYQTKSDVERSRATERKQLLKEIDDMSAVIEAERRSIGALQHAMYAQAAWGDSVVNKRRKSNLTHNELLQDIKVAQAETARHAHSEEVLKQRIAEHKRSLEAKSRRLQELQDYSRIHSLQIEEMRSAVVTGKRDMVRAQTLESECNHVARVAQDKVDNIGKNRGGSMLAHAAGQMFVSALGGDSRPVSTTGVPILAGDGTTQGMPHQLATGTQRYNKNMYHARPITEQPSSSGSRSGSASGARRSASAGGGSASPTRASGFSNSRPWNSSIRPSSSASLPQQRVSSSLSGRGTSGSSSYPTRSSSSSGVLRRASPTSPLQQQNNTGGNPISAAAAALGMPPANAPFGWTGAANAPAGTPDAELEAARRQTSENRFVDAKASSAEWLRRYVGSLRGLHVTALETATFVPM